MGQLGCAKISVCVTRQLCLMSRYTPRLSQKEPGHGPGTRRSEANAGEPVLFGRLSISVVHRTAHLANRRVSFAWLARRTCNYGVEIIWRVALGAGGGGGPLDSDTSISGVHQYRHRSPNLRVSFQLPRREDWEPSVHSCSHCARARGVVDADRPRIRPSRVDCRGREIVTKKARFNSETGF